MTLVELLNKNDHYHSKSGKGVGTDKEWRHKYCSTFYDEHFVEYKDKPISLLEIGTGHGGGLIMWNDYFEQGQIYGIDVNDYTDPVINEYPRIFTMLQNAYDKRIADELPGFDIIIDDGPHTYESHVACIKLYLPKVKKGGIFVIEDIPNKDWTEDYIELVKDHHHMVVDTRDIANLDDNIMLVVWK